MNLAACRGRQLRIPHTPSRPLQHHAQRHVAHRLTTTRVRATNEDREQLRQDRDTLVVAISTAVFTGLAMVTVNLSPDVLRPAAEFVLSSNIIGDFGFGDLLGGVFWSIGLYLCSPLQYLLLFFGMFDTERPADWMIRQLGILTGQRVDDIDYQAPLWLRALVVMFFIVCGYSVVAVLSSSLGESTWSVATGLGALVGAGFFEAGRPRRLSVQEAQTLELQWQDFAKFASKRLQRSGQCHETEVFMAFRREYSKYRVEGVLANDDVRSMVRNWHPDVRRSPAGYYKNLSLRPYVDPFTGERSGAEAVLQPSPPAVVNPAALLGGNDAEPSTEEKQKQL